MWYRFFFFLCSTCVASVAVEAHSTLVYGCRIPKEYFVTSGRGDTDLGPGEDPWETGSYDLALMDAKIENFNIIKYSSVLPPEATEIPVKKAIGMFHHGAVLETIMASANGLRGDLLCTGVGRIQVRRKSDKKHIGGFAAEYEKVYHANEIPPSLQDAESIAKKMLQISLFGEVYRRYNKEEYEIFGETFEINAFKVQKAYGTSLAALCFVSYIFPSLE